MWRRHSIAAKKAAGDAKKSQNYAKIWKIIQIAARKWADAKMNPSLDLALSKARQYGLPKDVVEKAILKWSWQLEWENLEEVFYEWYWPEWIALIIKTLTSNTNRTSSGIKVIMWKHWWTMGQPWSVSWQFKENGVIVINWKIKKENIKWNIMDIILPLDNEQFENEIMNLSIEDFEIEWTQAIIYTSKQNFMEVKKSLENLSYNITESDIQFIPENMVKISEDSKQKTLNLINALEDDEDVDNLRHNAEI